MPCNSILVIDIGTQSLRACIYDAQGKALAASVRVYPKAYESTQSGYAEKEASFYYETMVSALRELSDNYRQFLPDIKSMVVATFRDTAVLLDENNVPLRKMILWLDQRLARLPGEKHIPFLSKVLFRMVGMWETAKLNTRKTVAMWVKENEPEVWSKVHHYVPLGCYLNYRMTGRLAVSDSDVVGHYPFDFKRKRYLTRKNLKFPIFGIDERMNPTLVPVGEKIGVLTDEFASLAGLPKGITLIASGTDKACEVFGDGCVENTKAAISLGTACTIDIPSDKYIEPQTFLPAYGASYPGGYNDEVQIYRGFWLLKWYAENFASLEEINRAKETDLPLESVMDEKIENIIPGCDGLLVQPYWGPGLKRPLARGAIVGFRDSQDKYHIYRATIEGIAFALREGLEEMSKRMHCKVKSLVISRGGSRNDVVGQIFADVFNLPVYKTDTTESCSLGAAMSGFLSEGVFSSPKEAVEKMVHYKKVFLPRKEETLMYEQIYREGYLKLFPKLGKIYDKLDELARKERSMARDGKREE